MKKSLYTWQLAGFIFTSIMGILLHFLFDWTGQSILVAPFSAVNESIWEHMKLIFFPMFIFSFAESYDFNKEFKNFWCVKLIGIVFGLVLIPVLYYTLNGIFGQISDWVNIAIFFVTAALVYWTETRLLKQGNISCRSSETAFIILWLIVFAFFVLTFAPPQIPLFEDPLTKTYGYSK